MPSADFTFLTLRKVTPFQPNGQVVQNNYVFTVSSGRELWTNNLNLNNITASTISVSTINGIPIGPSGLTGLGSNYWTKIGPTGFSTNDISIAANTGPTGAVQAGTGAIYSIYNGLTGANAINGDVGITNNLLVAGATTYPDGSVSISNTQSLLYPVTPSIPSNNQLYFTQNTQTTPPINKPWTSIAMSASGQYQTAVYSGSLLPPVQANICYSIDYGYTWTLVIAPTITFEPIISSVAMSSSGQYQIAVTTNGANNYLYYSTNYGIDWNSSINQPGGWASAAISSSGQYQIAATINSRIYYSTDYGSSFQQSNSISTLWKNIAMSASGQYISVTATRIYISKNYGVSFQLSNSINVNWKNIAMSSSGQYQCAVNGSTNSIYISKDYGQTWIQSASPIPTFTSGLGYISMSSSGQYVIVTGAYDIYYSNNYGMDFIKVFTITNCRGIAMSSSGQYITLVIYNTGIYTCTISSPSLSSRGINSFGINEIGGTNRFTGGSNTFGNNNTFGDNNTFGNNNRFGGLQQVSYVIPTIIISGVTITLPTNANIVFVTGTGTVNTITNPFSSGFSGQITIIPLTVFSTTAVGGNIALGSTTVISKALIMTYTSRNNPSENKWYPSY